MQEVSEDKKIDLTGKNKVLLIYNPKSGSGMFQSNLDKIVAKFQSRGMIVVPLRADGSVSIESFLSGLNEAQYRKIIAAGGDGTINIVVNAMMKNDLHVPLALFPAGTANDFAHYFDIPTDIDGMLSIALEDNYMDADLGKCNDRYFVNVAAIGPVIDVSQKTDATMKNALGIVAYYLRGLSEVKSLKPVEFTITSPQINFTGDIFFMVVMNGNSAGGFRRLGVQSSINDGLLDVIIFKEMNFMELLPLAINVLQGRHDENKNVIYFQTPSLRIESPADMSTDVDGERGEPLPLDIEIVPRRLKINTRRSKETVGTDMNGKSKSYEIISVDDHESLNRFYEKNDLEISEEDPIGTDAVKSWVLVEDEKLAGAATLALREGEYIIDGIALDESYRGGGRGTALLNTVIDEVRKRGGSRIYLVARAPEFFGASGFKEVERADAPEFFECFGCSQYGVKCFPKVMEYILTEE
ncbi:MAG: YegS/Rv2252/BmrU family lipid kinase [Anaerovoracaceae bacterium]